MKLRKTFILLPLLSLLFACGKSSNDNFSSTDTSSNSIVSSEEPPIVDPDLKDIEFDEFWNSLNNDTIAVNELNNLFWLLFNNEFLDLIADSDIGVSAFTSSTKDYLLYDFSLDTTFCYITIHFANDPNFYFNLQLTHGGNNVFKIYEDYMAADELIWELADLFKNEISTSEKAFLKEEYFALGKNLLNAIEFFIINNVTFGSNNLAVTDSLISDLKSDLASRAAFPSFTSTFNKMTSNVPEAYNTYFESVAINSDELAYEYFFAHDHGWLFDYLARDFILSSIATENINGQSYAVLVYTDMYNLDNSIALLFESHEILDYYITLLSFSSLVIFLELFYATAADDLYFYKPILEEAYFQYQIIINSIIRLPFLSFATFDSATERYKAISDYEALNILDKSYFDDFSFSNAIKNIDSDALLLEQVLTVIFTEADFFIDVLLDNNPNSSFDSASATITNFSYDSEEIIIQITDQFGSYNLSYEIDEYLYDYFIYYIEYIDDSFQDSTLDDLKTSDLDDVDVFYYQTIINLLMVLAGDYSYTL